MTGDVNQYTKLVAPLAWRACETFAPHKSAGMIVTEATDVFMLGCTFIEVLTGCSRQPYDWLLEEDPSGVALTVYRGHEGTRNNNPLVVRLFREIPSSLSLCPACFLFLLRWCLPSPSQCVFVLLLLRLENYDVFSL